MQKHVHLVDLVKSFPTNIFLQNLASIQKRTSPIKFDHLAKKSEKGSISNLSTKVRGTHGAVEAFKDESKQPTLSLFRERLSFAPRDLGPDLASSGKLQVLLSAHVSLWDGQPIGGIPIMRVAKLCF